MPRSLRALTLLLAVLVTLSAMGCSASDKHVFVSTVHQPTTLILLDTYQNESVWEMDIPVNHMLKLDFQGTANSQPADASGSESWVDWELYRVDSGQVNAGKKTRGVLVDNNRIELTGTKVRMQVSYRPSPEMPGSLEAAPVPVRETAESVAAEAVAETRAKQMDKPAEQAAPAEEAAPMEEPAMQIKPAEQPDVAAPSDDATK